MRDCEKNTDEVAQLYRLIDSCATLQIVTGSRQIDSRQIDQIGRLIDRQMGVDRQIDVDSQIDSQIDLDRQIDTIDCLNDLLII